MIYFQILITIITYYLLGSIPLGYLIGKCHGIDIRTVGSKNVGATNVTRIFGKKWGLFCFILDFFKGFFPVMFFNIFLFSRVNKSILSISIILIILSTVFGHMYSIYIKFKGGKGVSTTIGALFAIIPLSALIGIIVWIIIFKIFKYASLASICAAILVPILTMIFSIFSIYIISYYLQSVIVLLAIIIIIKHSANIKRLINGSENRFTKQ